MSFPQIGACPPFASREDVVRWLELIGAGCVGECDVNTNPVSDPATAVEEAFPGRVALADECEIIYVYRNDNTLFVSVDGGASFFALAGQAYANTVIYNPSTPSFWAGLGSINNVAAALDALAYPRYRFEQAQIVDDPLVPLAAIDFINLPDNCFYYDFHFQFRTNRASNRDGVRIQINGDTGDYYIWRSGHQLFPTDGSAVTDNSTTVSDNYWLLRDVAAATQADARFSTPGFIRIYNPRYPGLARWASYFGQPAPEYTATGTTWNGIGMTGQFVAQNTLRQNTGIFVYMKDDIIDSISFIPDAGTAFVNYSRCDLWVAGY